MLSVPALSAPAPALYLPSLRLHHRPTPHGTPMRSRPFISNFYMMPSFSTSVPTLKISSKTSSGRAHDWQIGRLHVMKTSLAVPNTQRQLSLHNRSPSATVLCVASLASRCAAEQTQTVTRESSTITLAPNIGKQKVPILDDGGSGFPPRGDGGGGGGGGGGGHKFSGGFYFFSLLLFLRFLKDQEKDASYRDSRR